MLSTHGTPTLWRAMTGNPLRFLFSSWPWRSLLYVGGTLVSCGLAFMAALVLGTFPPALLLIGLPVGAVERWRLRVIERGPVQNPHLPMPLSLDWLQRRVSEPATSCHHVSGASARGARGSAANSSPPNRATR